MVGNLLTLASEYLPEHKVKTIKRAYVFAEEAHRGQVRRSGGPFIEHPLETASFLASLRLDGDALVAALLHDVMEDCDVSYIDLENQFGTEVANLVDGVTKLTKTEVSNESISQFNRSVSDNNLAEAATLRKMLMAMAEDVRVVLIKLADRLHNMKTLDALPSERRVSVARETLDIFAPLAHRLGIWEIKWRLEDLAFQHLNPDAYKEISRLLKSKRTEREQYINRVQNILDEALKTSGIESEVSGRPKHIYSIYKKMDKYRKAGKEIGEIYDLFALRVLVGDVGDSYSALGIIHNKWHPIPGQFDDYIANPKDNLYQSLHTIVLCEDAHPVEVQIRTRDMHNLAEYGVAAHWLYKEGEASDFEFEKKMTWLRQILEWQREVSGAEEFVESFKTDIFKNQVFVYTPKGDLKELPAGSTPLDFAFRIHTDLGMSCIGAKVNGKLVPLHYNLQNGDTTEIMASKAVIEPSLDWLNPNLGYVNTASARSKIRQWFNREERQINIQRGQDLFIKQVNRLSIGITDLEVARLMGFVSVGEFYGALGDASITISQVVDKLSAELVVPEEEPQVTIPSTGPASGIEVLGVGDLLTRIAKCCNPIYGDDIVGYITRNRGVSIHLSSCAEVTENSVDNEELTQVQWGRSQTIYPVRIQIEAWDRVGLLRDITSLVYEERVNIHSCVSEEFDDVSVISLTVYTNGLDQLNRLFSKLEGIKGVINVTRARTLEGNLSYK